MKMTVLAAGFVGWLGCFAVMGFGMATLGKDNALIVHAVAAPGIFAAVSLVYFSRFGYTSPLLTAAVFIGLVVGMDFFLVALVINRSLDMFGSPIGTWIPFTLIFASTYLTGTYVRTHPMVSKPRSGTDTPGRAARGI
jgi:hypothetical protein